MERREMLADGLRCLAQVLPAMITTAGSLGFCSVGRLELISAIRLPAFRLRLKRWLNKPQPITKGGRKME